MHWRRNVLRRLISLEANKHESTAHAKSEEDAKRLADFKPTLDTAQLSKRLKKDFEERKHIAEKLKASGVPMCPDSHFEAWVAPEHEPEAAKALFTCLQVDSYDTVSKLHSIHSHRSLFSTVANPADVREALLDTEYAYLMEGGATEVTYEQLKKSD